MKWTGYSCSSVGIPGLPPIDTTVENTDLDGDKLAGGGSQHNNPKALQALSVHLLIEASTVFRLLTPPQSDPIVAALQSVGRIL
jgi:hypothetical protein